MIVSFEDQRLEGNPSEAHTGSVAEPQYFLVTSHVRKILKNGEV